MERKQIFETETFKNARKLVKRTEIARAFNCEGRIALKLTANGDDYGDVGTLVKMASGDSFEPLTLRRYSDEDGITLVGRSCYGLFAEFGRSSVLDLYDQQNRQTVKDGDKVVIVIDEPSVEVCFVVTGTLSLPPYRAGYQYTGRVVLD